MEAPGNGLPPVHINPGMHEMQHAWTSAKHDGYSNENATKERVLKQVEQWP